jgi:hypothetical protein
LRDHGIYVISAENPRGAPVFKDLVADPPTNEDEFRGLWKLYFLALVVQNLLERGENGRLTPVVEMLQEANLIAKGVTLRGTLCSALDYVRSLGRAESAEGGISHQALAAAYCFLAPPAARGARRRAGVMDLQVVVVAAESLK